MLMGKSVITSWDREGWCHLPFAICESVCLCVCVCVKKAKCGLGNTYCSRKYHKGSTEYCVYLPVCLWTDFVNRFYRCVVQIKIKADFRDGCSLTYDIRVKTAGNKGTRASYLICIIFTQFSISFTFFISCYCDTSLYCILTLWQFVFISWHANKILLNWSEYNKKKLVGTWSINTRRPTKFGWDRGLRMTFECTLQCFLKHYA